MNTPNIQRKLIVIALAAAALLTVAACKKEAAKADATAQTFGAAPVKIFKAARERITEKLTYTGTLEALNKINITPETGGKIARIYVEAGDRVAKGQLLAELETESIRLQLKQAEAGVSVAEASYADALRNKERMDRLIKESAVSEQQREKIQLAFDAASAQLEQARAGLNMAQYALNVSLMKAPFNGVVASKNAEVGDVINPMMGGFGGGAGGVLTLMDYSKIKLAVAISAEDIGRIRKGQEAVLRVGSLPGREFRGTVRVVNLTADPHEQEVRRRGLRRQSRRGRSVRAPSATSSSRSSPMRTPWSCPRRPSSRTPMSLSPRAARPSGRTSRSASRTRR